MPQLNVLSMWLTAWALWCSVAFPQSTVAPPENTGDLVVQISGRNGGRISGLMVTLTGGDVDRVVVPSGRPPVRFESLPFGTSELKVVAEHFLPRSRKVIVKRNGWTEEYFDLTLDEASVVEGEVSDVKGSVVVGANVTLSTTPERLTTVGDDGRFRFEEVSRGTYKLKVELETFKTAVWTIVVGEKPLRPLRLVLEVDPVKKPFTVVGF